MTFMLRVILAMTAASVTACATPYQPHSILGGTGGYTEQRVDDDSFYIESLVNIPTGPAVALQYWHRRASELCKGRGYTGDPAVSYERRNTQKPWPLASGTATCKPGPGARA
jgi:hypothetical protein